MRKSVLIALAFLLLSGFYTGAQEAPAARYGFIISVDGLRPDAIREDAAPNLWNLIKKGSYTGRARTVNRPKTLPAHVALVTGLSYESHGVHSNDYTEDMGYVKQDTVFKIAKANGLSAAIITGKKKLTFLSNPKDLDYVDITNYEEDSTGVVKKSALSYIEIAEPGIALIHFPEPDISGHATVWMSSQYMDAVTKVDSAIGEILKALNDKGIYGESVIFITSDHGGSGNTHGEGVPLSYDIPWLAVGNNIKSGYKIEEPVRIQDTAPTVLKALGLENPAQMDGRVVEEIFIKD